MQMVIAPKKKEKKKISFFTQLLLRGLCTVIRS